MTIFLSQLWGPVVLAVGLGVFINREYYARIFRDLEKETLAVFIFGMIGMAVGIAHVMTHNSWESLAEILVSLLGWLLLIRGVIFVLAPRFVDTVGNLIAKFNILPYAGGLMLATGAYLTWFGYFM